MKTIQLELTLREADVIRKAIQGHHPSIEDEMLAVMLYARITRKLEEETKKSEN